MFSEILRIKPQLDQSDLNRMERSLSQRFTKVAKNFGKVLSGAAKLSGIGFLIGALGKILTPLQGINETLDKILDMADKLSTFSSQFNTDSKTLAKLNAVAASTGIGQDQLINLLTKYQVKIAEARTGQDITLTNYAQDQDIAKSFANFIDQMRRLEGTERTGILKRVFGEGETVQLAELVQTDISKRLKELNESGEISRLRVGDIEKSATLQTDRDIGRARNQLAFLGGASKNLSSDIIKSQIENERVAQDRAVELIKTYSHIANIDSAMSSVMNSGVKIVSFISESAGPFITTATDFFKTTDKYLKPIYEFVNESKGKLFSFFGLGSKGGQ